MGSTCAYWLDRLPSKLQVASSNPDYPVLFLTFLILGQVLGERVSKQ